MTWAGDLGQMVRRDQSEAARLRGAMSLDEEPGVKHETKNEVLRLQPARKRRFVTSTRLVGRLDAIEKGTLP